MATVSCCVNDCTTPPMIEPSESECQICWRRYCLGHFENHQTHPCWPYDSASLPLPKRDQATNEAFFANLDIAPILSEASALRDGLKCTGPPQAFTGAKDDPHLKCGGINAHFKIEFEDGVKWMVRMRKPDNGRHLPEGAQRSDLVSEIATCRVLREAGLMVPKVWLPQGARLPDLQYFFMEFVAGKKAKLLYYRQPPDPTPEILTRISSIAKYYIALEKITFDKVGSLTLDAQGAVSVGPRIDQVLDTHGSPWYLGPFNTAQEYYVAKINNINSAIMKGTYCRSKFAVDAYLKGLLLKDLVLGCQELEKGPWHLGHGEPRGDHFFFRSTGRLSGVIDWQWSFISCKADALRPPWWYPWFDYCFGLNEKLGVYEEALGQAYRKLGRPDLADLIPQSRKFYRLAEQLETPRVIVPRLNGTRRAFLGLPDELAKSEPDTLADWRKMMMDEYSSHPNVQILLQREAARPLPQIPQAIAAQEALIT